MEKTPVVSVRQKPVTMQYSVMAKRTGCIRNAVTLRDPCAMPFS